MNKSYSAVYYNPAGQVYDATIFLSTITLSIRYKDHNEWKDVYWLADNIVSLEEKVLVSVIEYKNKDGKTERLVIRDGELLQAIKKNFNHHRFVGGWKYHVFGNTKNKLLLFIAVIIVLILTGYFYLFLGWVIVLPAIFQKNGRSIWVKKCISLSSNNTGSILQKQG